MTTIYNDKNHDDDYDQVYAAMAESLGGAWKEIHQAKILISCDVNAEQFQKKM